MEEDKPKDIVLEVQSVRHMLTLDALIPDPQPLTPAEGDPDGEDNS